RRHDDVELVDDPGIEALPDLVGAATNAHVLVACGSFGAIDRRLKVADEGELAGLWLLLGPVGDHEDGDAERVLAAPVPRGLVHVATDDDRSAPRHHLVQVLGVLALGFALRLFRVAPGAAHDPVVEALPSFTESLVRAVVRAGDVAVHRRRDCRDDPRDPGYLLRSTNVPRRGETPSAGVAERRPTGRS